MKNKNGDMTVAEAADVLGVTTRSVLNYIKAKEIEAIKVGKSWFIRKASLEAFSHKFGIRKEEIPDSEKEKKKNEFRKTVESAKDNEKRFSVKNLRLFNKASDILKGLNFKDIESSENIKIRLEELKLSAIELLGAGYYSFEPRNKMGLYNESRQKVGGILALTYYQMPENHNLKKAIDEIENDLLPAYSALIKRMDRKREKYKDL
jgi:excisionase family DNA binding protein